MKLKTLSLLLALVVFAISCGNKIDEKSLAVDAEKIALLQCKARVLRNERFDSANNIRLREEDLLKKRAKITAEMIQHNDSVARDLTNRTATLASTITQTLDSLWKNKYKKLEQRQQLDQAVEKIVSTQCGH
ncbi:MAG: hypothetical protein JNL70_21170 [Saprospiraceae bacterium]|nr:hypothetical protein [Saprospiraceae bacterium]